LAEPAQKNDKQPVTTQKTQGDERLYFEEDFYLSDNGEKLPINSIAAELLDTIMPQSFRQVAERADAIVIGTPLESLEESEVKKGNREAGMPDRFSVSDFEIERVLKGDFQTGDTMSLGQDVVISDRDRLPVSHKNWNRRALVLNTPKEYRPVRKGSTYILFLYKRNDAYFPIFYALGRFNVDGTDELNYEPYGAMPAQLKIRDYALELYQAAMKEPDQNPLTRIVEQSDSAFVEN
jgi:hypothetical protein